MCEQFLTTMLRVAAKGLIRYPYDTAPRETVQVLEGVDHTAGANPARVRKKLSSSRFTWVCSQLRSSPRYVP